MLKVVTKIKSSYIKGEAQLSKILRGIKSCPVAMFYCLISYEGYSRAYLKRTKLTLCFKHFII